MSGGEIITCVAMLEGMILLVHIIMFRVSQGNGHGKGS